MDEITQQPDAPFSYGYSYYGSLRRTKDGFVTSVYASNNKTEECVDVILSEHKRIKKFGFTDSELDRAKKQLMKYAEKRYLERNDNESFRYTWRYYSHFLENEPIPSDEFLYNFVSEILPDIKLEDVNDLVKEFITDNNRVIIITGPENEKVIIPDKETVSKTINNVDKKEVEPYQDIVLTKPLMDKEPMPGKVINEKYVEDLDLYEFELSNGAKVVLKSTDFKKDEIWVYSFSPGGYSLHTVDEISELKTATSIINECGAGNYNKVQLDKFLSDKIIWNIAWIGECYEGLYGNTRPADLETMLQLFYLTFTNPKFTEEGVKVYIDKEKTFLENKNLDPSTAFYDTINNVLNSYSPWKKNLDMDMLKKIDLDKVREVYKKRFSSPSDFTFIFIGAIDKDKFIPLIEKYIAAIPETTEKEKWKDLGIKSPEKPVKKVIKRKMEVPKATVQINYYTECPYNLKNIILLDAIKSILDTRYTETIREEQGGTYGVSVRGYNIKIPKNKITLTINFDCDPKNVEKLKNIAYEEIKKLKENGPEQKYLDNYISCQVSQGYL